MTVFQIFLALAVIFAYFSKAHAFRKIENPLEQINVELIKVDLQPSVSLVVSPETLASNGAWHTVEWKGLENPSKKDWIAVYIGNVVDPTQRAPVKYKKAIGDPQHLKTGSGSLRFRLLNMRDNYTFALLRGWSRSPKLVAVSNTIQNTYVNEATQIHLALTGREGEMRVSWTSDSVGEAPRVLYSMDGQEPREAAATSSTYALEEMCGGHASGVGWMNPGYFHVAIMSDLEPKKVVQYSVGDAASGYSSQRTFFVPPPVGPQTAVNFFIFGDMGQAEADGANDMAYSMRASLMTMQRMEAHPFFLDEEERQEKGLVVLHIGDISYARGYVCQWDVFFDQIEPLASKVPWMVGIGNHERDWPNSGSIYPGQDSGGECGVAYNRRFNMPLPPALGISPQNSSAGSWKLQGHDASPAEAAAAGDTPWYSFNSGMAHVVVMSTEHDFSLGSLQYVFLEADLAAVNYNITPWIIFTGHRPMYVDSTYKHNPDGDIDVGHYLRVWIEPLLVKYQVDLALWGHHHSYQRSCPIYNNECLSANSPDSYVAPVHLVVGMAGYDFSRNLSPVPPSWLQYANLEQHGFLRLSVNETLLHHQFIGNDFGLVVDEGSIIRKVKKDLSSANGQRTLS